MRAAFNRSSGATICVLANPRNHQVCLHDMIIPSELARGDSNSTLGLCKHYLNETYDLHRARLRIDDEALQMRVQNVLDEAGACGLVVRLISNGGPIADMKAAIQLGVSMLKGDQHDLSACCLCFLATHSRCRSVLPAFLRATRCGRPWSGVANAELYFGQVLLLPHSTLASSALP